MKRMVVACIVFSGLILCFLGGYYGYYYHKAKSHDVAFGTFCQSYQNLHKKMVEVQATRDLPGFLDESYVVYEGLLRTRRELHQLEQKNFITRMCDYPVVQQSQYESFFDRMRTDYSTLIDILNQDIQSGTSQYRSSFEEARPSSVLEASQITEQFLKGLNSQKYVLSILAPYKSQTNTTAFKHAEESIDSGIQLAKRDLHALGQILKSQRESRETLKEALSSMEHSNQLANSLGQYASSQQISSAYDSWMDSCILVKKAMDNLTRAEKTIGSRYRDAAHAIYAKDLSALDRIFTKASAHRDNVYNLYSQARQQESSVVGNATRSAGRAFSAFMKKASNSRIGKEVRFSAKTLILGTKIFYDFMSIGPNDDLVSFAMSYESDLNQLMDESEEIRRMDEASLTGKNTMVEDLVNSAYRESFQKDSK